MRLCLLSLALALVLLGCTSQSASPVSQDSGVAVSAEDGSTVGCTSLGGTCEPYADSTCPTTQQNPTLCENTILLCCLPAGGPMASGPTVTTDGGGIEDATQMTADASVEVDASED